VVDGNVERVMARVFAAETPLPAAKPELTRLAAALVTEDRPGDWAQALMDLGAMVCRPRSPLCDRCPVAGFCAARKARTQESYPRKSPRADRPRRHGVAYVTIRDGKVALVRRPPKGLLGGMLALPTSDWISGAVAPEAGWSEVGEIEHVFTHFALTLKVVRGEGGEGEWTPIDEARQALPSVFRKALDKAL
jgi:A/G-specific adenine glycosylase